LTDCRVFLRISRDEGKTWSEPITCTDPVGYYVLNNDRAVRLTGGRILLPVALHATPEQPKFVRHAAISCFWSDDDGKTWSRGASVTGGGTHALEEPGVIELKDGRVMLWCRTDAGCQFTAFSVDRGEHWSELKPSSISSPRSPASIKRIPSTGDLLLVWNNNPDVSGPTNGKRTPLSVALSRDDGVSWEKARNLEDNPDGWYCYIAIHFAGERVILGHCADNVERSSKLATTQITSFPIQWLYGG
jgi:predicted neuraminidase